MEQSLISKELYLKLRECRDRMRVSGVPGWKYSKIANLASVFVPVRPRPTAEVPFRVLVIGQATKGFSPREPKLRTFETTTTHCVNLVEQFFSKRRRSPFWDWIRSLLSAAYEHVDLEPTRERLVGSLGWSNFAKIGDVKGNPPPWTVAGQADLAAESLRSEIATMAPTLIVACIGQWGVSPGRPIFERVFGNVNWQPGTVGHTILSGIPVVLTDHPTILSIDMRWDEVLAETTEKLVSSIS